MKPYEDLIISRFEKSFKKFPLSMTSQIITKKSSFDLHPGLQIQKEFTTSEKGVSIIGQASSPLQPIFVSVST